MGKNKDWNTPLTPEELKEIQKRLKGKGGSPGDVWKKIQASNATPLMISHGEYFNQHGQPIKNPAFGIDPAGNPINLPHMEQTPEEKIHNQELHKQKYHNDLTKGWSKRLLKQPKLAAANNIRRLKDSGHETDYTGGFRLGDDGKLIPQLGIRKKQAKANNIRRLQESGHQLVIDDNDPKKLKIIKQFRPRA